MAKNILLSTLGGSPKTVTQMYQALKFAGVSIAEIHLIRTIGSHSVPERHRPQNVIWNEHSCSIKDIRSQQEARQVADLIFDTVKSQKQRSDVERLFMDLTGGRKTMSSYLMAAAQLLCDGNDALYHVETNDLQGPLRNPSHPQYSEYYYPQSPQEVELIHVPFVSLSPLFQAVGSSGQSSFWQFLEQSVKSLEDLCFCGIIAAGIEHEAAPIFASAFQEAPEIRPTLNQIYGIFKTFHTILRHNQIHAKPNKLSTIFDEFQAIVSENIDIQLELPQTEITVSTDKILLLRILNIVVANAVKHGEAEIVSISVAADNQKVHISIRDDGRGMPTHICDEAFLPFKSYPRQASSGKQVGLPVAKKLAQACGGDIAIAHSDSSGTIVVLTLPQTPG